MSCGHAFVVSILDNHFNFKDIYSSNIFRSFNGYGKINCLIKEASNYKNKRACPTCRMTCTGVRRYDVFEKLNSFDASLDHVHLLMNKDNRGYLQEISKSHLELKKTAPEFRRNLKPGPLATNKNKAMIIARGDMVVAAHNRIEATLCEYTHTNAIRS